jgi:hypothetical protein
MIRERPLGRILDRSAGIGADISGSVPGRMEAQSFSDLRINYKKVTFPQGTR